MSTTSFSALLQRIQQGLSSLELIYTSHPRWPLPAVPRPSPSPDLHVSVLDSSFNPPTLAHLALARLPRTARTPAQEPTDFDARLLLLSVRNADKQLKPGDATYEQRVEMMTLMARDLAGADPAAPGNVAVAIVDAPTFVDKSSVLLDALTRRISEHSPTERSAPRAKVTFVVGTDTLARIFSPRFYADEQTMLALLRRLVSADGDDARIVCARRMDRELDREEEERQERGLLEFAQSIRTPSPVHFVDIGEQEREYSSTQVRALLGTRNIQWRSLLLPSVADFIASEGLYLTSS